MKSAAELVDEEIGKHGAIPFARFMELALYAPEAGYYERATNQIGRRGDFYTSVSVGPFFGELLAFQFGIWIEGLQGRVQLVEAGAHNGQLGHDVLTGLRKHFPALLPRIDYVIVEPSKRRRDVQADFLRAAGPVRWVESLDELKGVQGVIFSNELLDAMPVHRFEWNQGLGKWEEIGVSRTDGRLVYSRLKQPSADVPHLPQLLLDVLPDGYVIESCPGAAAWWRAAAGALAKGRLMTIDYGNTFEEMLNPGRKGGTVRAYSRHRISDDPLERPGEQDITAHVDFNEVIRAGEAAGLKTEMFLNQSQFLTGIARELWTRTRNWPQEQARQFQTLTHPEHLGRPFRVLVQAR